MEAGDAPAATSAVAEDDANDDVDVFVVRVPAEEAAVVEYRCATAFSERSYLDFTTFAASSSSVVRL